MLTEKQLILIPKRTKSEYLEHFLSFPTASSALGGVLNLAVNQTGSLSIGSPDTSHPGVATLSTSTGTTGRCGLATNVGAFTPGAIAFEYECAFKLSALSNATDSYSIFLGFSDVNSSAAPSSAGLGLYYTQGQSNFTPYSKRSASVSTATGFTADTNWHVFNMKLNKAATSASFTLDGGTVQTITTNLPNSKAGLNQIISKSVGTTAVTLQIDYIYLKMDLS